MKTILVSIVSAMREWLIKEVLESDPAAQITVHHRELITITTHKLHPAMLEGFPGVCHAIDVTENPRVLSLVHRALFVP